jgi:hypothetical protein
MADDSDAETPTPEASKAGAEKKDGSRNKRLITGAAIGIGSAALVAALLYANRRKNNDRN